MKLGALPLLVILTVPALGQAGPQYPQYTPGPASAGQQTYPAPNVPTAPMAHAPDGGTREQLISISVPLLTNSPFTATVDTEWIKILPDGSTATNKNRRTIARDSSGRVFEERHYLTPNGDTQPRLSNLQYRDPNRHESTNCVVAQRVCYVSRMMASARSSMPAVVQRATNPNVKEEALGDRFDQGLNLVGTRQVTTIPTGAIGNTKPEPIVKEFWYSPVLGVNMVTKRFDPRTGSQNFVVSHLMQTEPDAKLFALPSGYRIVRQDGGQGGEITP